MRLGPREIRCLGPPKKYSRRSSGTSHRKLGTRRRESTRRLGTVILKDIIYAGVFQRPCRDLAGGHATWVRDQGRSHDTAERVRKWMTQNGWIAKIDRVRNKFRWFRFKGSTPVYGLGDRVESIAFPTPKTSFASPNSHRASTYVRATSSEYESFRFVSRDMSVRDASRGPLRGGPLSSTDRSESSDERLRSKPLGSRNRLDANPAVPSVPEPEPDTKPVCIEDGCNNTPQRHLNRIDYYPRCKPCASKNYARIRTDRAKPEPAASINAAPNPTLKGSDGSPEVQRLPVDESTSRVPVRRDRLPLRQRPQQRQNPQISISTSQRSDVRNVLRTDGSGRGYMQGMRSKTPFATVRKVIQRATRGFRRSGSP